MHPPTTILFDSPGQWRVSKRPPQKKPHTYTPTITSQKPNQNEQAQAAIAHYNMRDFDGAQRGFQQLREGDPYRLENLERCAIFYLFIYL